MSFATEKFHHVDFQVKVPIWTFPNTSSCWKTQHFLCILYKNIGDSAYSLSWLAANDKYSKEIETGVGASEFGVFIRDRRGDLFRACFLRFSALWAGEASLKKYCEVYSLLIAASRIICVWFLTAKIFLPKKLRQKSIFFNFSRKCFCI